MRGPKLTGEQASGRRALRTSAAFALLLADPGDGSMLATVADVPAQASPPRGTPMRRDAMGAPLSPWPTRPSCGAAEVRVEKACWRARPAQ